MDNDEIKRINYLHALNDKYIFENLENDTNNLIKITNNIQESNKQEMNKNVIQNRIHYVKTPCIFRSKL